MSAFDTCWLDTPCELATRFKELETAALPLSSPTQVPQTLCLPPPPPAALLGTGARLTCKVTTPCHPGLHGRTLGLPVGDGDALPDESVDEDLQPWHQTRQT